MAKPLPTGCIKQCSDISLRTFNFLSEKVSLNDQIDHLYVADIEFDHTKTTKRQIVQNEIYQESRNKKLLIRVKNEFINSLNNFLQLKKEILVPIEQQKKLMQLCLKKGLNQRIWSN